MSTNSQTISFGRCPRCGAPVIEGSERYGCEKSFAEIGPCKFIIGKTVLGQPIDRKQVQLLLTTGRTDLLGEFVSKSGRKFAAYLVMDDMGKVGFEFPSRDPEERPEPQSPPVKKQIMPEEPCKPLFEAATISLFQHNAFRITGLSVDATIREITKHGDRLKLMEELGQGAAAHKAAFPLNPPPTLDHIRDAIHRLKDPERRLVDEFFWFWPEQFGVGQSDPAIQALVKGDAKGALEIWKSNDSDRQNGVTARHNLAIFWHLAALEWENKSLTSGVDRDAQSEKEAYWCRAFEYWEGLILDDGLWERFTARIRQIDDPRLQIGFARRMRSSLPGALGKINAELALSYAKAGQIDLARFHAKCMHKTNQGLDDLERTVSLVLAPTTNQLREHIRQAKTAAQDNPGAADETVRSLLRRAQPLLNLLDLLHGQGNASRDDLFDEVAAVCLSCAIEHQLKTHDDQIFVALLQQALLLAASVEVKQRIEKNIGIGKGNLARKKFDPIYEKLSEIEKSSEPPQAKLARVRNEIVPQLEAWSEQDSVDDFPKAEIDALSELSNSVAIVLRGISIEANNNHDDMGTAANAIVLAGVYAKEKELEKRVAADLKQLNEIHQEQGKNNLRLKIRSDEIEITREKFRYNADLLKANEVNGVRFGIYIHTVNGIRSAYYTVGACDLHGHQINIDCKRVFRSEAEADADWRAIVNALYRQIVPGLCTRLVQRILSGTDLSIGEARLCSQGMCIPTGMLFWKETPLVPYPEIGCSTHQGTLHVVSTKNRKISKAFALREVWNAVILEDLVKAICHVQGK